MALTPLEIELQARLETATKERNEARRDANVLRFERDDYRRQYQEERALRDRMLKLTGCAIVLILAGLCFIAAAL